MIGALSDQLALPLEIAEPEPVASCPERAQRVERATGPVRCCPAPYCSGCVTANTLSEEDAVIMRAYLDRLLRSESRRRRRRP